MPPIFEHVRGFTNFMSKICYVNSELLSNVTPRYLILFAFSIRGQTKTKTDGLKHCALRMSISVFKQCDHVKTNLFIFEIKIYS